MIRAKLTEPTKPINPFYFDAPRERDLTWIGPSLIAGCAMLSLSAAIGVMVYAIVSFLQMVLQ